MRAAARAGQPYLMGLGRAVVGALFFAFPLLMTMEMWELGFHMDRLRLALFVLIGMGLIYGLAHYAGFRASGGTRANLLDAFSALAIGFLVSGTLLTVFGIIEFGDPLGNTVGKVALQAAPAAMGAILARKQLQGGGASEGDDDKPSSYVGELFLMAAGAVFVAFNVAPTEEMILISFKMGLWRTVALMALSIALLHAIVYRLGFAGQEPHDSQSRAFVHFTAPGYAIALAVSLYVLWTFGRTDGVSLFETVSTTIVLGFPAALGAALARLVV